MVKFRTRAPLVHFSSFSCSFGKIWLNNRLARPLGLVPLPIKSWICRCLRYASVSHVRTLETVFYAAILCSFTLIIHKQKKGLQTTFSQMLQCYFSTNKKWVFKMMLNFHTIYGKLAADDF